MEKRECQDDRCTVEFEFTERPACDAGCGLRDGRESKGGEDACASEEQCCC
jgi:hypothetical protein